MTMLMKVKIRPMSRKMMMVMSMPILTMWGLASKASASSHEIPLISNTFPSDIVLQGGHMVLSP